MEHLDGQVVLSRKVAEKGRYPAVDVFQTTSTLIDADKVGERIITFMRRSSLT